MVRILGAVERGGGPDTGTTFSGMIIFERRTIATTILEFRPAASPAHAGRS